jgi:hypothetical protein
MERFWVKVILSNIVDFSVIGLTFGNQMPGASNN